jgi:NADH-quinone oxidoreductase subunit E
MKRYDLRHLKKEFESRMFEIVSSSNKGEVLIFLFEIIDEESLQKLMRDIDGYGHEILNSLRFNEVDWTLVLKIKGNS